MIGLLSAALTVTALSLSAGTDGLLVEDHRAPLVTVMVQLPVGTATPWAKSRPVREAFADAMLDHDGNLRRQADRLAVQINLGVGLWSSTAYLSCHKRDLPAALALLRAVLDNHDIDSAQIKRRHREEWLGWQTGRRDAQTVLSRRASELLFAADDPRRHDLGPPRRPETNVATLLATRRAMLRLPGRTIGMAGDVTESEMRALTRDLLPEVDAAPPQVAPAAFPALLSLQGRNRDEAIPLKKATQVNFAWVRAALPIDHPDFPALMVARDVLGGHFYSRLYVALRHAQGDTYGASAVMPRSREGGTFRIQTFTRLENRAVIEAKLRETLATFRNQGISEQERTDAVGALLGERNFGRQAPDQLLSQALWEKARGLPLGYQDQLAERVSRLTVDQINQFISDYFDPAEFVLLRTVPRRSRM